MKEEYIELKFSLPVSVNKAYCRWCWNHVWYILNLKELKNGRPWYLWSDISTRVWSLGESKKKVVQ